MRPLLENLTQRRQRPGISGRDATGCPRAARMEDATPGGGVMASPDRPGWEEAPSSAGRASVYSAGRLTRFGLAVAAITCIADQLTKLWILFVFDLRDKGAVVVTPFMDLVMTWNRGI